MEAIQLRVDSFKVEKSLSTWRSISIWRQNVVKSYTLMDIS